MELQGKIKDIKETQTFGSNGFRKREIIITTDDQYPQHILIEFVQDKTDLLDNFAIGQDVNIGINIRGREWANPQGEVKYFNSIQGWKINQAQPSEQQSNSEYPITTAEAFEPADDLNEEDHDDLPF